MPAITTTGVDPRFDGDHELDVEAQQFNGWELHIIKKISGLRPLEYQEALEEGDYDLVIALAVVALIRAGKLDRRRFQEAADGLLEAEAGKITMTETPGDASPPQPAPPASGNTGGSGPSGQPLNGSTGHPVNTPTPTGLPG